MRRVVAVQMDSWRHLPRVFAVHGPHHVTQRGNARRFVLDSDKDRSVYLDLLKQSLALHDVTMMGYCLMSNHVHLVLVTRGAESLGLALKHAHGLYASTGTPSIIQVVTFGRGATIHARWMSRIYGKRCAIRSSIRCGPGWWRRPNPGCGPVPPPIALPIPLRSGWVCNCGSPVGLRKPSASS